MAIVYASIGTVGNTGTPPDVWGHNAVWPEGLARDASNNIYEVRGFDEPHHDIVRRSITTGAIAFTTDQVVSNYLLIGIAMEADASWAYCCGFELDNSSPQRSRTAIFRINMAPGLDRNLRRTDFTTAGNHIETYAYGDISTSAPDQKPLHCIAISGSSIWVTDNYGNRLIRYDKVSGVQQQVITGITGARGLAIDGSGNIWVGCETNKVKSYNSSGTLLNTSTLSTATTQIVALSCVGSTMAVAFQEGVHTYTISGGSLTTKLSSYGQAFRPGDKDADRIREVYSMVMLSDLSIVITDRVGNYGRIQRTGSSAWVQYGLEFTSSISFAPDRANLWISSGRNCYTVNTDATWTLAGCGQTESFTTPTYFGHYQTTHQGVPRVVKLGSNYFFYYPAGMSLGVYRVIDNAGRGPSLQLCSVIGSGQPSPTGADLQPFWQDSNKYTWQWTDSVGDGVVTSPTIIYKPSDPDPTVWWYADCYTVDMVGTVWARQSVMGQERVVKIPLNSLNGIGNPVYHLADMVEVFTKASAQTLLASSANLELQIPFRADGDVYTLVKSEEPGKPWNPGGHMGGNAVICFSPTGTAKWGKFLPFWGIGFAVIDTNGGFVVGTNDAPNNNNTIFHYDKDGNQLQKMVPDPLYGDRFGGLDSKMSINCQRDSRDGKVKVFAADNISQRILIHSIDDSGGSSFPDMRDVILTWDAPNPSPPEYAIYKTSGGVSTKLGNSTATIYSASVLTGDQLSVRCVSSSGVESADSIKVTVQEPAAPPLNLRVRVTT